VASASDEEPNYNAWKAFENLNTNSDAWSTDFTENRYDVSSGEATTNAPLFEGERGDWIQIQLPSKIKLDYILIDPRRVASAKTPEASPGDGRIFGSINGTNWTLITSFSGRLYGGMASNENATAETVVTSTDTYYNYYRLQVTKRAGQYGSDKYVAIGQLEYFGTPEYDPEAHGVDVVVKSVPNVPNTDWLEVYYDAKDLADGAVSTVTALGGTTISGSNLGNPQISNGAFVFDGTGDCIVSGATSLSGNPQLSYSVWFKTNSIDSSGSNSIVMIGYAANTESIGFRINSTGYYRFYVYGGATNESITTNIEPELGKWTHAIVVYDGLKSKLYIDGKFALQNTNTTTNLNLDSSAKVALGDYIDSSGNIGSNASYDGSIANFRLFNRALSTDEIYQLYAYQKEYFGYGDLSMTLKAGRLGIGTSEPRAALDVHGELYGPGTRPCFSIHTIDYWGADDNTWGSSSGTHWATWYRVPIPCVRRGWLEHDSHNAISFEDVTRGSNTGTIVRFTAPRSGFYHFSFNIGIKSNVANDYLAFMLNKNQTDSYNGSLPGSNDYFLGAIHDVIAAKLYTLSSSVNFYLKEGEFVVPYSRSLQSAYIADGGGFSFSGYYVG
jgi:hypothetical protein